MIHMKLLSHVVAKTLGKVCAFVMTGSTHLIFLIMYIFIYSFFFSETVCPLNISNVQLPANCTAKVDEVCNGFTCGYGYETNNDVSSLNCTESGNWNYNVSILCKGNLYVISTSCIMLSYFKNIC